MIRDTLLTMLEGASFANAVMPWGKPGPIQLPDDPHERGRLVDAHLGGEPADVLYSPRERLPQRVHVRRLALAAFCPATDGRCRWLGVDLDAADHGPRGLADPVHAARCLAERADMAGLLSGLLIARSRGERGRHVLLILPAPVSLADAVIGVAALVADAFRVAAADRADHGTLHAFRTADGRTARPGEPGAIELIPRGSQKPEFGWPLALPAAGAFVERDGGVIVDPFADTPWTLVDAPRCDARCWSRFVAEARARLAHRSRAEAISRPAERRNPSRGTADPLERADSRTRAFLDGRASEGMRNTACFAAACNLIGVGATTAETERLVLAGAAACGLPQREARTALASAIGIMRRKGRA
jgi:hypothetical protein